ncbi:MAG: nucleoside diphosphate kinase regulator [Bacteroidetes bacterium]|nr:MAG: nucleoside diphosphate kinase regulator [Bacteroidota bacterium]
MDQRPIFITATDHTRLMQLLTASNPGSERSSLRDLVSELKRAVIVPSDRIPPDIVTMRSRVRIADRATGEESEVTLVFPKEADVDRGLISVLAPVGTALLGYRAGDTVEWKVPAGVRSIEIREILYQPEAAGDMHR